MTNTDTDVSEMSQSFKQASVYSPVSIKMFDNNTCLAYGNMIILCYSSQNHANNKWYFECNVNTKWYMSNHS